MNDITIILGHYKRWYNLREQFESIKAQTIQPKEIWIVQNSDYFEIPQDIKDQCIVIQSNNNLWVWFRFTVGLLAKTKYICMFDDDTIPGNKWLENCLNESQKQRWLYGTIWCVFGMACPDFLWHLTQEQSKEYYYSHIRHWRANSNEQTVEVDLVWHSWFFEREFLSIYFKDPIDPDYPYCWEDMHFTYALQKYLWLWTYVPPHPKDDLEMRGSRKGWELGTKDSSWAQRSRADWNDIYDQFYKWLRNKGFKILQDKEW